MNLNTLFGSIKILSVSNSSNVQFGDAAFIVLSSTNKMYGGANAFSPGDSFGSLTNNPNSSTNTSDPDIIDGANTSVV
ncbi:spore germination protein [Paenibacillus chondroitinus]|uniref:Spore germination protein n=1 Tax=Paenibacillus chondroitinus TaxID=59842 RepID=A0ABU6DHN2_9BACL|nr:MULTISPECIES: spore germination protein [Paenibacillus]MCY9659427.1 spore germination protein [Paenibacillus anseongense]MEB4796822.1 spore germination protein [Paenibacillus chondroitinus]